MRPGAAAPPGPRGLPGLGARASLLPLVADPVGYLFRLHATYGEVATARRGTTGIVFVFSPALLQRVLGDPELFRSHGADELPVRPPPASSLARLFAGLHQMNGATHRRHRRMLASGFTRPRLVAYHEAIVDETRHALRDWAPGQVRDGAREMTDLTLRIAVRALLGLGTDPDAEAFGRLLEAWLRQVFHWASFALPVDLPGLPYRRLHRLSDALEQRIRRLIERKADRRGEADLLSTLLAARGREPDRVSDDELVGQVAALFVAGHELSAGALAWTLFLLTQHPRVANAAREEVDCELRGGAPTHENLESLRYLDAVLRESMRLLPPVVFWSRRSTAAFELGPYVLPPRTTVVTGHVVTHRLPGLYANPDRFVPERWLGWKPGPYAYLPFSAGPRRCLGEHFAMSEMKVVLSMLLQRVQVSLPEGTRVDRGGLLLSRPRGGLPIRLEARGGRVRVGPVRGNISTLVELPFAARHPPPSASIARASRAGEK